MVRNLINVIRALEEMRVKQTKVQECRQRPEEHPSDYWGRLRQALLAYGGMTLQNFNNELAASVFVDQATSDICSYFKDHMLGWQGENLKDAVLPGGSILVQYVDDSLVASKTYEDCLKDTICLRTALAEKCHCASLSKLQLCQQEVKYLGFVLKEGQRLVDPERVQAIVEIPRPVTKMQLRGFLGAVGYYGYRG